MSGDKFRLKNRIFYHLPIKNTEEERSKLKIRPHVSEIRLLIKWLIIRGALSHWVHVVVAIRGATTRQLQKLGSHSLFLSPLSQYFLPLLSSSLSSLGGRRIRTYNNSLSYLVSSFSPSSFSVSLLSIFRQRISSRGACNKILFLPFLFAASGAGGDSPKTNLEIVDIALLIPMYPAFEGGHCTFSGTHTVSGPAAAATSPLAVWCSQRRPVFLVVPLPLALPSAHRSSYSSSSSAWSIYQIPRFFVFFLLVRFPLPRFVFPFQQQ